MAVFSPRPRSARNLAVSWRLQRPAPGQVHQPEGIKQIVIFFPPERVMCIYIYTYTQRLMACIIYWVLSHGIMSQIRANSCTKPWSLGYVWYLVNGIILYWWTHLEVSVQHCNPLPLVTTTRLLKWVLNWKFTFALGKKKNIASYG